MQQITKEIGNRIRSLRAARGHSQESLADCSGLSRSHLGEIERGECDVTLATLLRVVSALQVPLSRLTRGLEDCVR